MQIFSLGDNLYEVSEPFSRVNKENVINLSSAEFVHNIVSVNIRCHFFVCVEVLRPSQPNGVMSSAVSLPNHTFTGQA